MTREEARKAAEVMLAYANGEEIEYTVYGLNNWEVYNPQNNRELCFNWSDYKYRVKPEPTYRPFKNKEECWNEMLKHEPFGWIKNKDSQFYESCRDVGDYGIFGASFNDAYKDYTFADGTPFGIKGE